MSDAPKAINFPLVKFIGEWVHQNVAQLDAAWSVGGPIENWLQVQVAVAAKQSRLQVVREAPVYGEGNNRLKADFWVAADKYFVELKVEGSSENGAKSFYDGVMTDIDKLIEKAKKESMSATVGIVLGISRSPDAFKLMQGSMASYTDKVEVISSVQGAGGSTYTFWARCRQYK